MLLFVGSEKNSTLATTPVQDVPIPFDIRIFQWFFLVNRC